MEARVNETDMMRRKPSESFGALLPTLRPYIPRSLIDDEWLERIARRLCDLPGAETASGAYWEFRLSKPAAAADFVVAVGPGLPLLPYYIRRGEAAAPGSPAAALGAMLSDMRDSGEKHKFIGAFLEYDIAETPAGARPEPGVFLALWPDSARAKLAPELACDVTALMGWTDEGIMEVVRQASEALPHEGEAAIRQIGAMPGRELRAIKILVSKLAAGDIPDYLERARWPGDAERVRQVVDAMSPLPLGFSLSIDMLPQGLLPRLGVEIFPLDRGRGILSWGPTVERLAEMGWCLDEKKRGLLEFPGIERIFRKDGLFVLYKGIGHAKITVHGDKVEAKAYAGLKYLPFSESLSFSDK